MKNVPTKTTVHPSRVGMVGVALLITLQLLDTPAHVLQDLQVQDVLKTSSNAPVGQDLVTMEDALTPMALTLVYVNQGILVGIVIQNTCLVNPPPAYMVEGVPNWIL